MKIANKTTQFVIQKKIDKSTGKVLGHAVNISNELKKGLSHLKFFV